MGMAAGQARFLGLTARKNNTEYEGQQINQQRTALSNQTAVYNSQLLNINVPTPPSTDQYTKTVYSWTGDDQSKNSIEQIISNNDSPRTYTVKYNTSVTKVGEGYIPKTNSSVSLTKTSDSVISSSMGAVSRTAVAGGGFSYSVGANNAVLLADDSVNASVLKKLRGASPSTAEDEAFYGIDTDGDKKYNLYVSQTELDNATWFGSSAAVTQYSESGAAYTVAGKQATLITAADNEILTQLEAAYKKEHPGATDSAFYGVDSNSDGIYDFYCAEADINESFNNTSETSRSVARYLVGTYQSTEAATANNATLTKDANTGRLTSIIVDGKNYTLSVSTEKDEVSYDSAMNAYEYEKAQYNKTIEDINSKISIVQSQDKSLELQLKQLDTEQEAIQTELDAVKKVIDKSIEGGFKTFA